MDEKERKCEVSGTATLDGATAYFFDVSTVSRMGHQKEAIGIFFVILANCLGVGQILTPKILK